jgi:dephospho-CoA kinase
VVAARQATSEAVREGWDFMLKLGLTGSIATGKSTVLAAFAGLGIPTFSADAAVHELYAGEAAARVEGLFPGTVVDGVVDRNRLSARLVGHPERLAALEAAIHPLVRERIGAFLAGAEAAGAPIAVVDIPLLYENGVDWGFDAVIVVAVAEPEQRRRALARPGMTGEKLDAILARQLPQSEKVTRADHVIRTDGAFAATQAAVGALVDELRRKTER